MPRRPSGKRIVLPDGSIKVRGKNPNREGSVYAIADGTWRATWFDRAGKMRVVRGRDRRAVEARRAEAAAADRHVGSTTFTKHTTVAELADWWLDNVAAGNVRPSSLGKYQDRVARIAAGLGTIPVVDIRGEGIAGWLAQLGRDGLAPSTVRDTKATLNQVLEVAVDFELIPRNPAAKVKAPKARDPEGRALTIDEAKALLTAAAGERLGAAVWLLFVQGWRVSEVLGLAWEDLDLAAGTATVKRACVYVDGQGTVLGPPKTEGAKGVHHLDPSVVIALQAHRRRQAEEQMAARDVWTTHTYDGRPVSLVFTTLTGGLVNRQQVTKVVARAAAAAGIDPKGLGTHSGRRTVITALYGQAGIDLEDIARHVGHASSATTAGYVRNLGKRRENTQAAVARLFGEAR